ncbi:MAG: hypothetical protein HYW24_03265 [Candidatus Aenigmarchaeota archaeon]|nr:hypothetical protein [Candidatus Aenigmarchaeota archaeon]
MRIVFSKKKQYELFNEYKNLKNCTWRALSKTFNIDWRTTRHLRDGEFTLSSYIFEQMISEFPELKKFENFIVDKRDDNWGSKKGWKLALKTIRKKLKNDVSYRNKWIEKCKVGGANNIKLGPIKNWEIGFRNIGRRRFIGPKGEKMFTKSEYELAKYFNENKIPYVYEPKLEINGRNYFPDFKIRGFLIERCGLVSKNYFISLNRKLKDYNKLKKKVIIVMPKRMRDPILKNVKIPKNFIQVIEDDNLTQLRETIGEYIGM